MTTVNRLKRIRGELIYRRGTYYVVSQIDELIRELEGQKLLLRLKVVLFLLMLALGFSLGAILLGPPGAGRPF